jgi:signal transduction histidine kinase
MKDSRASITQNIVEARARLEEALMDLARPPALDPSLLSTATHALNNCLLVVKANVDLALDDRDRIDNETVSALLDIRRACDGMKQIVASLRTQVALSKRDLVIQSADILTVIRRAATFYRPKADAKDIRFIEEYPLEKVYVTTDVLALGLIIDNLMSNAIKYSPGGKAVHVTVRLQGSTVECSVRDEGPGISPADQLRMYQRGARLTAQPTAGEPSTGYGLAIAKEAAEMIGASLSCQSTLGQGALFTLGVPTAPETTRATD